MALNKGRPAGSANKSTEQVRRAISELLTLSAPKMISWLDMVANGNEDKGVKADPGKAVDLVLKAAEYHIPKLARTELSALGGQPLIPTSITITHVKPPATGS